MEQTKRYFYATTVIIANLNRRLFLSKSLPPCSIDSFFQFIQVLIKESLILTVAVYTGLGIIAGVIAWLLPVETKGVDLSATGHQFAKRTKLNEQN